ncbi:MAG: hypothetical protein OXJ37_23205 [Bryobacterales bacterium]|nr:hypothetical protein [Bryobacterales bacterium]
MTDRRLEGRCTAGKACARRIKVLARRPCGVTAGRAWQMAGNRISVALLVALWCGAPTAHGQGEGRDILNRDETALIQPTSIILAVWTDRLGYLRLRDTITVYHSADPNGDRRRFREFLFLENIESGQRMYLRRDGTRFRLHEEIVDSAGLDPRFDERTRIELAPPTNVWSGRIVEPGLWQFVAELRSPDTTEIVKRAHAKFVVSATLPATTGPETQATQIAQDTTWTNDTIHSVRGLVFVTAGATLTIEPGTLVLARGPQAVIVVEPGARIMAEGRPDAPIVMTCDEAVGERFEGCWGGLVILGRAPTAPGTALAGVGAPATTAVFGGEDPIDASGTLRYVRVEFAGGGSSPGTQQVGLGFYGVGSGTAIDYVQSHASAGDGIRFVGGTANCGHCVSSGASDDGLEWAGGWQGSAQHLFLQQALGRGDCGIEGHDAGLGPGTVPRLYNVTVIGSEVPGLSNGTGGCAIRLGAGSSMKARNVIVTGFVAGASEVRDRTAPSFRDGARSMAHSIVHAGGDGYMLIGDGMESGPEYLDENPKLVNVHYAPNPDPRPKLSSSALMVGAGAIPPSDGFLDTSAQQIGAFRDSNWLEEWTFFGPESDYRAETPDAED